MHEYFKIYLRSKKYFYYDEKLCHDVQLITKYFY